MAEMMTKRCVTLSIAAVFLAGPLSVSAEQEASLPNGDKVILRSDGTWRLQEKQGTKATALKDSWVYEDDQTKVSFEFQPGETTSSSILDREEPFQHIRIKAINKSTTKIAKYRPEYTFMFVKDNFGNSYKCGLPQRIRGIGRDDGSETLPGKVSEWQLPITSTILPIAESLEIRVLQGSFDNREGFEVVVPLKGEHLVQVNHDKKKSTDETEGSRYIDESVSIDFGYQPGLLKNMGSLSNKSIAVRITNISKNQILHTNTHSTVSGEYLNNGSTEVFSVDRPNVSSVEDNFGNGLRVTFIYPNLDRKEIEPGRTVKTAIVLVGKLLPDADCLTVHIPARMFGNSKTFDVGVPLKPSKTGFVKRSKDEGLSFE